MAESVDIWAMADPAGFSCGAIERKEFIPHQE